MMVSSVVIAAVKSAKSEMFVRKTYYASQRSVPGNISLFEYVTNRPAGTYEIDLLCPLAVMFPPTSCNTFGKHMIQVYVDPK